MTQFLLAIVLTTIPPAHWQEVNDQLHTPVVATIVVALWVEILNYLNIYQGLSISTQSQ